MKSQFCLALALFLTPVAAATQNRDGQAGSDPAPAPASSAAAVRGSVESPGHHSPDIALARVSAAYWSATYRLHDAVRRLAFASTPDDRRARDWTVQPGFQIVYEGSTDYLQRLDGRPFREARVESPTAFVLIPKAYLPFSPFTDGGLLIYSGRFFACPESCAGNESWNLTLRTPRGLHSIVGGSRRAGTVRWHDLGAGKAIYVGRASPLEDDHLVAVIDPGLPQVIRVPLANLFPAFMNFYRQHLGPLTQKPEMFVSFSTTGGSGFTMKGSLLPNQVFMHLFGDLASQNQAQVRLSMSWFFAHEASHLFQGPASLVPAEQAWIHEGAAELFAARLLAQRSAEEHAFADTRVQGSIAACARGLAQMPLSHAHQSARDDLYYSCGLVLQNRFDHDIIAAGRPDGIFALWREYRVQVDAGAPANQDTYLAVVESLAGARTAEWARRVANTKLPDPAAALAET
jgi:hypothetical protein